MHSFYRGRAIVVIFLIAAIITPPDLFTLIIVTLPVYGLYEVSILIVRSLLAVSDSFRQ